MILNGGWGCQEGQRMGWGWGVDKGEWRGEKKEGRERGRVERERKERDYWCENKPKLN